MTYSTIKTNKPLQRKTALKSNGKGLRKTPMRKVGKVGKANAAANRKIRKITDECELYTCEIGALGWPEFADCLVSWPLQNCHRHKRSYYKGDAKLLAEIKQWVKGCQVCHERIEHDKELTEKVFISLRGPE